MRRYGIENCDFRSRECELARVSLAISVRCNPIARNALYNYWVGNMDSIEINHPKTKRRLVGVLAATAVLLSGCFPYAKSYIHLSGKGVDNKREACDLGAPVAAIYTRGEVEFEVSLDPGFSRAKSDRYPQVTIRAPESVAVTIPTRNFLFVYQDSNLSALSSSIEGKFDAAGRIEPTWVQSGRATYRLRIANVPDARARGSFRLPTIYADGVAVPQLELTFEPRAHVSVLPLNC